MKDLIYVFLTGLLLWTGIGFPLQAQNNPFRMHDSIYVGYREVMKHRADPDVVPLIDALCGKARALGDKKGECVVLCAKVAHYFYRSDSVKLLEAVRQVQQVSRRSGYLQYYYYASADYIYWLLNHNHTVQALQLADEMQAQAERDKHDYGIYSCFKAQGYIYYKRGDLRTSIRYHEEALAYQLKYLPEQDAAPNYNRLAALYREAGQLEKALDSVDRGINVAKTVTSRKGGMVKKCRVLFAMGREDEFLQLYAQCQEEMKKTGPVYNNALKELAVYADLAKGDYAEARKHAGKSATLQGLVALRTGDYKTAYAYSRQAARVSDSIVRQIQTSDLAELNVQLHNERMKREAKELETKNSALSLANARLELEQAQSEAALGKAKAEYGALALRNRTLELERVHAEVQRRRDLLEEDRLLSRNRSIMFGVLIGFLLLSLGLLCIYLYRRRLMVRQLQEKNRELAAAHEQAEKSNRMKTLFLHNMSQEIRTPLNAIVGFSQLLATSGSDFSEEEKDEYSHIILHNSELLTSLVNDILDTSNLESEKGKESLSEVF